MIILIYDSLQIYKIPIETSRLPYWLFLEPFNSLQESHIPMRKNWNIFDNDFIKEWVNQIAFVILSNLVLTHSGELSSGNELTDKVEFSILHNAPQSPIVNYLHRSVIFQAA